MTLTLSPEKKMKQRVGARIFEGYVALVVILMGAGFMDVIPVYDVEKMFNAEEMTKLITWLRDEIYIPVLISSAYVVIVFGIQWIMKERQPFDLRLPLAAWSLLLATFSLIGAVRVVPKLLLYIQDKGLDYAICGDARDFYIGQPATFWGFLFLLSKIPELVDTLFIVLRKKNLIFLHWYHHITVMLYCWRTWATYSTNGIFFAAMNLTVHAFMYFFYFLTALGYRPTIYAQSITIMQIVQMIAGSLITFYVGFHMTFIVPQDLFGHLLSEDSLEWNLNLSMPLDTSPKCKTNPGNGFYGMAMYGSYLWLFSVFFYRAYIQVKPLPVEKKSN